MTSYANEGIHEVETPHCRTSVQVRLPRRTRVLDGDHTHYSLVPVTYLVAVVHFLGGHFLYANEENPGR